jgi:hypothetical protein
MRSFTIMIAAAGMTLIGEGSALADCRSLDPVMPVGAFSGDPEKDTFGLACTGVDMKQPGAIAMTPRMQVMLVGTSTGEADKDSFGFVLVTEAQ